MARPRRIRDCFCMCGTGNYCHVHFCYRQEAEGKANTKRAKGVADLPGSQTQACHGGVRIIRKLLTGGNS